MFILKGQQNEKDCKPFASHSSYLFIYLLIHCSSVKSYLENPILTYLHILNLKEATWSVCEKATVLQIVNIREGS